MNRVVRSIGALVVSAGLALGLAPVAGAVDGGSSAATSETTADARCAQLRKRLAGAPATRRRIDANLEELRARLTDVRVPARRTLLEERVQRLEQLRTALADRIVEARAACATIT